MFKLLLLVLSYVTAYGNATCSCSAPSEELDKFCQDILSGADLTGVRQGANLPQCIYVQVRNKITASLDDHLT